MSILNLIYKSSTAQNVNLMPNMPNSLCSRNNQVRGNSVTKLAVKQI